MQTNQKSSYATIKHRHHAIKAVISLKHGGRSPATKWCKSLAHPRRLETDTLTSLTDSQLDRTTDDAALSCPLGLAFTNKESALRTETLATLVTIEAALVPLATDCADDNIVHDLFFAAQTTWCGTARVAVETPREAIFLDKGSLGIEGLYEKK